MANAEEHPHTSLFARFLHSQTSGSLVLIAAAVAALVWANSPWRDAYHALSHAEVGIKLGHHLYELHLGHLVKDGLMAVFFFVVGLEIKREILLGELSSLRKAALPVIAALGGAVVPALIYVAFNTTGEARHGWGVPMATDIAFALGLLSLFGSRVPIGLKVFLTALAIADDIMAVLVIAAFYTEQINLIAVVSAFAFLGLIALGTRLGVRHMWVYLLFMFGVWVSAYASGIHATTSGVMIALLVPMHSRGDPRVFLKRLDESLQRLKVERTEVSRETMVRRAEQREGMMRLHQEAHTMLPPGLFFESNLHTFQAFIVLPLFALFSAGVAIDASTFEGFPSGVGLGIILGLVVGKQVGVCLFSWLTVKFGAAELPAGVTWGQMYGVSALSGIGFTMSIFISELGFEDASLIAEAKIAIFIASFVAGLWGYLTLLKTLPRKG